MKGYVLHMSPTKMSRKKKPYFNLNIECDDQVHNAVFFSPSIRKPYSKSFKKRQRGWK